MSTDSGYREAAKQAGAEDYLEWFRHSANPSTLAEANVIADKLATLLEEVLGLDD